MKRLWAAVLLAVFFHVGIFWVGSQWHNHKAIRPPRSTAVTVTMSYRKPVKAAEVRKAHVKRPKITKPKKIKVHKKPEPKPLEPIAAKPEEQKPPPLVEEEDVRDAEDEKDTNEVTEEVDPEEADQEEADTGDAVSSMNVFREAVPLYKNNPPPRYPRMARKRGYQGKVVLSVYVDDQGRVENLWVFESSGYRVLDNSAVKAVKGWIFEPGMKGDKKVSMWVKVPVRFNLVE